MRPDATAQEFLNQCRRDGLDCAWRMVDDFGRAKRGEERSIASRGMPIMPAEYEELHIQEALRHINIGSYAR